MKFLALLFALCAYISADVMFACVDHRDIVKEFQYDPASGGMTITDIINSEGIERVSYAPGRQLWGVTYSGYVKKKSESEGAIYTDSRIGNAAKDISAHYGVCVATNSGDDIYTKPYSGGSWTYVFSPTHRAKAIEIDCDEDPVIYVADGLDQYSYCDGYLYKYPNAPGGFDLDVTCFVDIVILSDFIHSNLVTTFDAGDQSWKYVDFQDELERIDCADKGFVELKVDPYNHNTFVYLNRSLIYSAYGVEWKDIAIEF